MVFCVTSTSLPCLVSVLKCWKYGFLDLFEETGVGPIRVAITSYNFNKQLYKLSNNLNLFSMMFLATLHLYTRRNYYKFVKIKEMTVYDLISVNPQVLSLPNFITIQLKDPKCCREDHHTMNARVFRFIFEA